MSKNGVEARNIDVRRIDAIFFDRGNVLYDCKCGPPQAHKNKDSALLVKEYLKRLNTNIDADDILNGFLTPWRKSFSQRDFRGHEIPVETFLMRYLERNGWQYDKTMLDAIVDAMSAAYLKWHEMDPSVFPLLKLLRAKGKKTGIISNAVLPDRIHISQLRNDGLYDLFDVCVFSGGAGALKPNRKMIDLACLELEVEPKACLLIGDKLEKDVLCAQNAGATSIWFNYSGCANDTEIMPDYEVAGFEEIIERLLI